MAERKIRFTGAGIADLTERVARLGHRLTKVTQDKDGRIEIIFDSMDIEERSDSPNELDKYFEQD